MSSRRAARKRAKEVLGPAPKKGVFGDRFKYQDELNAYNSRIRDRTVLEERKTRHQIKKERNKERKSGKSGCLSAILPPIVLISRLLPGLPELKLPEKPAEITELAPTTSEAGSLTVAAYTAEPEVYLEP